MSCCYKEFYNGSGFSLFCGGFVKYIPESFANNERISNFAAHFEDVIKNNIIN